MNKTKNLYPIINYKLLISIKNNQVQILNFK